jgi:PEP-CTERM motif
MKFATRVLLVLGLLPFAMAVAPANASTITFDWSFTLTQSGSGNFLNGVDVGSGTLTATTGTNGDVVTAITGSADGSAITGLTSFEGSDNLLFPAGPTLVDANGISFGTASGVQGNIYFLTTGPKVYNALFSNHDSAVGSFTLTPVPLPASWSFMLLGLAGIGGVVLWRNKGARSENSLGLAIA